MDSAHFTGLAVFAGSVVGALISLISTWLTMSRENRAKRVSENKGGRQKLYAQFIDETSKLYMDALVRDQAEASAMVSVYALLSKIRMASNGAVVEAAEAVIRTIITTYSRPNKTFPELQNLMLNRGFVDPLLTFSEVCRDELHDVPSRQTRHPPGVLSRQSSPSPTGSTTSSPAINSPRVPARGWRIFARAASPSLSDRTTCIV